MVTGKTYTATRLAGFGVFCFGVGDGVTLKSQHFLEVCVCLIVSQHVLRMVKM